ncbi:unnamed protein product [Closterium sp. Yama58-4]|nr:unnamed protein product [Closterium sp. Yama58-4]
MARRFDYHHQQQHQQAGRRTLAAFCFAFVLFLLVAAYLFSGFKPGPIPTSSVDEDQDRAGDGLGGPNTSDALGDEPMEHEIRDSSKLSLNLPPVKGAGEPADSDMEPPGRAADEEEGGESAAQEGLRGARGGDARAQAERERDAQDAAAQEGDSEGGDGQAEEGLLHSRSSDNEKAAAAAAAADADGDGIGGSEGAGGAKEGEEEETSEKGEEEKDGEEEESSAAEKPVEKYEACDPELSEIVPCLSPAMNKRMKLKLNTKVMEHYERHCPPDDLMPHCLVPQPPGYKTSIPWPRSRDEVWRANVPHTLLATEKSDQHWMVVDGDIIRFPGGGTHFPGGADKYIEHIGKMMGDENGNFSVGGKIRTVLDIGCGVASFGAYLLDHSVLTMSVAPNDVHENQIQFALERGLPAFLGVMGTQRLPFPSLAFDLAHCSRCRIDWLQRDGLLLLELDRVIRPGGYWVWSAPPVYREDEENQKLWTDMLAFMGRMCWKVKAQSGQTAIFKKPKTNLCIKKRAADTEPPLCDAAQVSPNSAWYTPMDACVNTVPKGKKNKLIQPWPERLVSPSPRIDLLGLAKSDFEADTEAWEKIVADYDTLLGGQALLRPADSTLKGGKGKGSKAAYPIRNVIDINAHMGGFAAALAAQAQAVWVMNTVPPQGEASSAGLAMVYDRGLIGVYHDWCEPFSTYPRTYDLVHAWRAVSQVLKRKCSLEALLLELDRILRPKGVLLFRDSADVIARLEKRLKAVKWIVLKGPVSRTFIDGEEEQVLVVQKRFWRVKEKAGLKESAEAAASTDGDAEERRSVVDVTDGTNTVTPAPGEPASLSRASSADGSSFQASGFHGQGEGHSAHEGYDGYEGHGGNGGHGGQVSAPQLPPPPGRSAFKKAPSIRYPVAQRGEASSDSIGAGSMSPKTPQAVASATIPEAENEGVSSIEESDAGMGSARRSEEVSSRHGGKAGGAAAAGWVGGAFVGAAIGGRVGGGQVAPYPEGEEGEAEGEYEGEYRMAEGEYGYAEGEDMGGDDDMYKQGVGMEDVIVDDMPLGEGMEERTGVMNYEMRERPEAGWMVAYALQHMIALIANVIVFPMILVPAMGGSDLDKAAVIQSVMMVTGVATTLHVLLGTRLPLVQGSSLVYLAPAIIVANSPHNLTADPSQRFSLTMRETMGAVIVASLLQVVAGYSGFMSLLIELINPVVVAPTIMAVGLSFLSYGFPVIGRCVAIGLPELILIVIFALYLRRVSFWGSRFFQIHAISLGLAITWLYALVVTLAGVYSYPDCSPSAIYPSSSPCFEKQALMASCRTDASSVLSDAKWVAPPYPFQYGMPIFRWESICIMLLPALISTIDSVSNYHATSLLVAVRPPTGGVVGRGIGMEGVASVLAGMWGTGGGATTLTENIHLVAVTRMGSRVTIIVGAAFLVFFSLFGSRFPSSQPHSLAHRLYLLNSPHLPGKVGALFASMPPVMVGGLLTIMAAMAASLGLSSLRYAEMGSSRNLLITGLALFLSLSVPDYFKSYAVTNGHGPINTSSSGLNFVLNSLLALPMAIAFMSAFLLDNTVPGTATERGLYVWSGRKAARADPLMHEDYDLPFGLSKFFSWVFWLGV